MFSLKAAAEVDPLAEEMARIRAAAAPPRKPAGLQLAERQLGKARADRAEIAERDRAAISAFHSVAIGTTGPTLEALRASAADLAEAEAVVAAARAALKAEREKHNPTFLAAASPVAADAAAVICRSLDTLDAAVAIMADLEGYASRNGLAAPRMVTSARHLAMLSRDIRRTVEGR